MCGATAPRCCFHRQIYPGRLNRTPLQVTCRSTGPARRKRSSGSGSGQCELRAGVLEGNYPRIQAARPPAKQFLLPCECAAPAHWPFLSHCCPLLFLRGLELPPPALCALPSFLQPGSLCLLSPYPCLPGQGRPPTPNPPLPAQTSHGGKAPITRPSTLPSPSATAVLLPHPPKLPPLTGGAATLRDLQNCINILYKCFTLVTTSGEPWGVQQCTYLWDGKCLEECGNGRNRCHWHLMTHYSEISIPMAVKSFSSREL
ncbi:uncharacterized protein LOC100494143 [Xenopus tropicalis]|uniref:Uncharacterized protein LOC100494143 n=1 Tax=Xenopus tropicalis TaxID=8364 RepID=A0A8J1JL55_XENTR|nr:uncharacterized protein LOC100494143 [Xenopus tropicalis]